MKLVIKKSKYVDKRFIQWLLPHIKYQLIKRLDNKHIAVFNYYLNKEDEFANKKINIKKILLLAIRTLRFYEYTDLFIICINEDLVVPEYDVTLGTLCRFLNYGNLNIKGYPIFTEAFNAVKINLKTYYKQYINNY